MAPFAKIRNRAPGGDAAPARLFLLPELGTRLDLKTFAPERIEIFPDVDSTGRDYPYGVRSAAPVPLVYPERPKGVPAGSYQSNSRRVPQSRADSAVGLKCGKRQTLEA